MRTRNSIVATLAVFGFVGAACNASGVTTTFPGQPLTSVEQPSTSQVVETTPAVTTSLPDGGSGIDRYGGLLNALDTVRDDGGMIAWTEVTAVGDRHIEFAVTEIVASVEYDDPPAVLVNDEYAGVELEVGERALVLTVAGERYAGLAVSIAPERWLLDPSSIEQAPLVNALGTEAEEFRLRAPAVTQGRCAVVEAVTYEDAASAMAAYVHETTPQAKEQQRRTDQEALAAEAGGFASSVSDEFTDAVTGRRVPVDTAGIKRQFETGVDPSNMTPGPTVPVFLDSSDLTERKTYFFVERGTDRLLGRINVLPRDNSGFGGDFENVVETFVSPSSTGIDVISMVWGSWGGCIRNDDLAAVAREIGTVIATIPVSMIRVDSDARPLVHLEPGAATVVPTRGPEPAFTN